MFANSRNVILDKDYYFERKSEYNISNPCLSKAIIYYIKNNNYIDKKNNNVKWIDFNVMNDIYKTYVEIFKNSVLVIFDGIYREDFRLHKKSFNEDDENSNSSKD